MAWPIATVLLLIAQGGTPAPATDAPAKSSAPAPAASKPAAGDAGKAAANAPAAAPGSESSSLPMILMLSGGVLWFYLLMVRPQKQQEAKHRQLLANLKKNDKVQTAGGILGTVVSSDPAADKVVVRIDDDKGVKITVVKSSIVRVIEPHAEKAAEKATESASS